MFTIRAQADTDLSAIETLNDMGFGPDRHSRTVWRLRQGPHAPGLGFVAADAVSDAPLATLRFWQVEVTAPVSVLLLGPLAVAPDLRGQGLGRALVAHGLQVAREAGWDLCLVSGEPAYYRPYGFEAAAPFGFEMPGPLKAGWLQIKELKRGALSTIPVDARLAISTRRSVRPGDGRLTPFPHAVTA